MTDSTYDEARRCPKCKELGDKTSEQSLRTSMQRGAKLHIFTCRNERCKWFETTWSVQVNPDGTIPPPTLHRDKNFRPLPSGREQRVVEQLERQYQAEMNPGAEVRNR